MKLRPASFVLAALTSLAALVPGVASAQTLVPSNDDPTSAPDGASMHRGFGHRHGHGMRGMRAQLVAARADGTVARYLVGPMGRVRSALLSDGTVVLLGHDGDAIAQRISVGQRLVAQGFSAQGAAGTLLHATVTDAQGTVLSAPRAFAPGAQPGDGAAEQPRHPHGFAFDPQAREQHRAMMRSRHEAMRARIEQLPQVNAAGRIDRVLAGPHGVAHALLLSDGTTVYLRGPIARALSERGVAAGQVVRASGRGGAYPQGAALIAQQLTLADGTVLTTPAPESMMR